MMKKWLILTVLVSILLLAATGLVYARTTDSPDDFAADQILVKFLPGTTDEVKANIHSKQGGKVIEVIPGIDVQVVRVPKGQVKEKVKAYQGEAGVKYAEPDYIAYATAIPNDTDFNKQGGMTQIGAPAAWDTAEGSAAVKIAICDTGIDTNHPDLSNGKIVANKNYTKSRTTDDLYGHGTHVAGIAAASTNNGVGVAGAGFNSSLMNVKVLGDTGSGSYSWIANGILWAANNGAKVINLSLGGGSPSQTMELAVNKAWGKGCVIVAAAGNGGSKDTLSYPAAYVNCIAVAATGDDDDARALYSNYGAWVDIAAPGSDIYSTLPNHNNLIGTNNYGYLSGTSMATPHVAGVAALVFAKYPGITKDGVRTKIESTRDATTGFTTPVYRLNAYEAVQQ